MSAVSTKFPPAATNASKIWYDSSSPARQPKTKKTDCKTQRGKYLRWWRQSASKKGCLRTKITPFLVKAKDQPWTGKKRRWRSKSERKTRHKRNQQTKWTRKRKGEVFIFRFSPLPFSPLQLPSSCSFLLLLSCLVAAEKDETLLAETKKKKWWKSPRADQ